MLVHVGQLVALEVAEELVQRHVRRAVHFRVKGRDVKDARQETSEYWNNSNTHKIITETIKQKEIVYF